MKTPTKLEQIISDFITLNEDSLIVFLNGVNALLRQPISIIDNNGIKSLSNDYDITDLYHNYDIIEHYNNADYLCAKNSTDITSCYKIKKGNDIFIFRAIHSSILSLLLSDQYKNSWRLL